MEPNLLGRIIDAYNDINEIFDNMYMYVKQDLIIFLTSNLDNLTFKTFSENLNKLELD